MIWTQTQIKVKVTEYAVQISKLLTSWWCTDLSKSESTWKNLIRLKLSINDFPVARQKQILDRRMQATQIVVKHEKI